MQTWRHVFIQASARRSPPGHHGRRCPFGGRLRRGVRAPSHASSASPGRVP